MSKEIHMGTTLFATFRLFDPLQQVAGSIARLFRRAPAHVQPTTRPVACAPSRVVRAAPLVASAGASRVRAPRRLRVVRVFDGSPASAGAGRMVISGRMADVCAELERLAAQEAAMH
jgi:hypothetical protein